MFQNSNELVRDVTFLTPVEKKEIVAFLRGAVYCWYNVRRDEPFPLQSLMGGDNFYWQGTPLYEYIYKKKEKICGANAVEEAAKSAGWLLKWVLADDKHRKYEAIDGYVKSYRCVEINMNLQED